MIGKKIRTLQQKLSEAEMRLLELQREYSRETIRWQTEKQRLDQRLDTLRQAVEPAIGHMNHIYSAAQQAERLLREVEVSG